MKIKLIRKNNNDNGQKFKYFQIEQTVTYKLDTKLIFDVWNSPEVNIKTA